MPLRSNRVCHRKVTRKSDRGIHGLPHISICTLFLKLRDIWITAIFQSVGTHTVDRDQNNFIFHFSNTFLSFDTCVKYIIACFGAFVKSDVAASRSDVVRYAHSDVLRQRRKVMCSLLTRKAHITAEGYITHEVRISFRASEAHRSKQKRCPLL